MIDGSNYQRVLQEWGRRQLRRGGYQVSDYATIEVVADYDYICGDGTCDAVATHILVYTSGWDGFRGDASVEIDIQITELIRQLTDIEL